MSTSRVMALCGAFGVVTGWLGAAAGPFAAAIANLSAPWLLVALLPGMRATSSRRGAVTGLACTAAALTAFYLTKTVVLSGHNGGHGFAAELLVEARANRLYLAAGAVTGPLFGLVGARLRRRLPTVSGLALAGPLLSAEVAVVAVVSGHQLLPRPLYFRWAVDNWAVYWLECLLGLGLTFAAVLRRRGHRRPTGGSAAI